MLSCIKLKVSDIFVICLVETFSLSFCQGLPGPKGIKGEPMYDGALPGLPVSSTYVEELSDDWLGCTSVKLT